MKLSFSIPSNSSSKSNPIKPSHKFDDSSNKQHPITNPSKHFLTEFDPSKPPTDPAVKFVIPPIQNQWRPDKKMKNPNSDETPSLRFEPDNLSISTNEPGSDFSFGLNLRHRTKKRNNDGEGGEKNAPAETVLLQKLKDDLKRLPEDQGFEEFKDVPVEGFGAALLAGYGWSEGMGIGKNAKEDVKVVQYEKRTSKEGLGFVSDDLGFVVGKSVRIVAGRDAGSKGSVVRRIGDDWVVLKLSTSGEEVKVKRDDVVELDSVEEKSYLRKLEELKIRCDGEDKRGRGRGEVEERRMDVNGDRKQVSWLTSHIRVRVISRDFEGGRLYLKKGEVLDVVGPTTCDISMDESKEIIQGVSQDLLETAIPQNGGPVLVLYGEHKGSYGSLVERDLDCEIGIVKDADTHALLNVKLEQIAEYIGDPSFLGH